MIDPAAEIEGLVAFENRRAGTDAERRAANHLAARLGELGRDSTTEPILVWPRWHLAHLLHVLLAIAGSAISVASALAGTILVALALVSAVGDLTGRLILVRRITGRRASQNVSSPEEPRLRPGTIVLTAHYDSGRGAGVIARAQGRPVGVAFVVALALLLVTTVARLAGLHNVVLEIVQFIPTVALIVSVPYLADVALNASTPGANDNASGVATVLRLAERYQDDLDHMDVWVVLTGAQEGGALGMRAWAKAHRRELNARATVVLNVDEVGAGTVRFTTKEGPLLARRVHGQLLALCRQLEEEDREQPRYHPEPTAGRGASDAYAARARGLPSVTVSAAPAPHHHRHTDTPENVEAQALERAFGFCSELIELIDEEIGPEIAAAAQQPAQEQGEASFTPS